MVQKKIKNRKRFLAAVLSLALIVTLFAPAPVSAATRLDSELTAAKKLGFLTSAQAKKVNKNISQKDAVTIISKAIKKSYGKTGKFLADRKKAASSKKTATKRYISSTLYFAAYEQLKSPKYKNYQNYMDTVTEKVYSIGPDADTIMKPA